MNDLRDAENDLILAEENFGSSEHIVAEARVAKIKEEENMTLQEWKRLYRSITSMSAESCEAELAKHGIKMHASCHSVLELRRELSQLCQKNGVSPFCW